MYMKYNISNDGGSIIIGRGIDKWKWKKKAELADELEIEEDNFKFKVFGDLFFDDIMDVREEYIDLMGNLFNEGEMPPDADLLPFIDEPYHKFFNWVKLRKRKIKLNRL